MIRIFRRGIIYLIDRKDGTGFTVDISTGESSPDGPIDTLVEGTSKAEWLPVLDVDTLPHAVRRRLILSMMGDPDGE